MGVSMNHFGDAGQKQKWVVFGHDFNKIMVALVALMLLSVPFLQVKAQTGVDLTPRQLLVNYSEVSELDGQTLRVYFNVLNAGGQALGAPEIGAVNLTMNQQDYTGLVTIPSDPLNVVLILDTSGSMTGSTQAMRQAAIDAINTAPSGTRFQIITFNQVINTRLAFTDDRNQALATIQSLTDDQFRDGTCLYDATFQALQSLQAIGTNGRRAAILFTDGRDELIAGGELDPCSTQADFARLVTTAQNSQLRIPIYTIGLQGREPINSQELSSLASSTGGISVVGVTAELSNLFAQIIQSFAGQRLATFNLCLAAGEYGGLMNLTAGGSQGSGGTQLVIPVNAVRLTTTCVVPTATPTPEALSLSIGDIGFDPSTNEVIFTVERGGDGEIDSYRIEIINNITGVRVPGEYGSLIIPADIGNTIRVPLNEISALEWLVRVTALDASGARLAQSEPIEIAPERTPTPEPTVTQTPTREPTATITPTSTFTPTPTVPLVEISSIQYLQDSQEFILNLRLQNVSAGAVSGYTIRVENDAQIQVASETYLSLPTTRITFPALSSANQPLGEGEYTITIEVSSPEFGLIRSDRAVTVPPPPATMTPTPLPAFTEQLVSNVSANPALAVGVVVIVFGVLLLLLLLLRRLRGNNNQRNYKGPAFQQSYQANTPQTPTTDGGVVTPFAVPPTAVDDGVSLPAGVSARITIVQSPDPLMQSGRTFEVRSRNYQVGRSPENDLSINADGVSKQHLTFKWIENGFFLIDNNSTNKTELEGKVLDPQIPYPLEANREYTIMAGKKTRIQFSYQAGTRARRPVENQTEIEMPALSIPPVPAPTAPSQPPPPTTPPMMDDMPTYVGVEEVPSSIDAELIVTSPQGKMESHKITARETTFGRKVSNTFPFDIPEVSREHAHLVWDGNGFFFEDLGSSNGSFVNGEKLTAKAPHALSAGRLYELRLGREENGIHLQFSYRKQRLFDFDSGDEPTQV